LLRPAFLLRSASESLRFETQNLYPFSKALENSDSLKVRSKYKQETRQQSSGLIYKKGHNSSGLVFECIWEQKLGLTAFEFNIFIQILV
jgi:hypothetical protein